MTAIKICGLTRPEDAVLAAELGADFLGFIFVQSSARNIEPARAADIVATVRERGFRGKTVGVFRDAAPEHVRAVATQTGLDLVQLHGAEGEEEIQAIGLPALKAFRIGDTLPDTTAYPSAEWLLFDTYDERRVGGTGKRFDWSLLALYHREKPFLLAGGITPENVGAAISLVRPDAVDVASGVEASPGVKDPALLRAFFQRVRAGRTTAEADRPASAPPSTEPRS